MPCFLPSKQYFDSNRTIVNECLDQKTSLRSHGYGVYSYYGYLGFELSLLFENAFKCYYVDSKCLYTFMPYNRPEFVFTKFSVIRFNFFVWIQGQMLLQADTQVYNIYTFAFIYISYNPQTNP